eukprot:g72599.t1
MCVLPNSPIPRRGVSVSLLLATYQRWEAAGLAAGATTDDVVRDLVKPATADQKCSYVELLARSQDPQDRAGVATATVFLSHAWKYTFKQVVEAIAAHWPDKDNVRSQTFLWFDIFTVNQHQTSTVDPDFWFEAFRENIFCTRLTKASFEICLSPTEVTDFEHALVKDFHSILGSLSRIDVKKAEAGKKEDQEKILALVEGMEGGAHELNKAVLAEMRAWAVQAGRDVLKARQGQTDEATLLLMHQVGSLLLDLGDLKGAEEFLRRALEAKEKTLGAEHPSTLTSVNNLATLLYDQGKLAEAEPLFRSALQGQEKMLGAEDSDTLTLASMASVLLLTDGQPNISPPRGEVTMLKKFQDANPQLAISVSTFGFGYNLDTAMLLALAETGHGQFAFIPDAGFVGTVFVHAIANLLATMSRNVKVSFELEGDLQLVPGQEVLGCHQVQLTDWGVQVSLAGLQYGQNKHVLIRVQKNGATPGEGDATPGATPGEGEAEPGAPVAEAGETDVSVSVKYETHQSNQGEAIQVGPVRAELAGLGREGKVEEGKGDGAATEILVQRLRLLCVEAIQKTTKTPKHQLDLTSQQAVIRAAVKEVKEAKGRVASDPRIKGLLEDMSGQASEAVSRGDYWDKWGMHYMPSLMTAHSQQVCNNFKDPGVQVYGGQLFGQLRDQADDLFMKLPPPEPAPNPYADMGGAAYVAPRVQVSMASFNQAANPCFHGDSLVHLADGSFKALRALTKGDRVLSLTPGHISFRDAQEKPTTTWSTGHHATVRCVVETKCVGEEAWLVRMQRGLLATPYHPVFSRPHQKWQFPVQEYGPPVKLPCHAVYSVVLDAPSNHPHAVQSLIINGTVCAALGHGVLAGDPVLAHPLFGSRACLQSQLAQLPGWDIGHVTFRPSPLLRDRVSGLLHQFDPNQAVPC